MHRNHYYPYNEMAHQHQETVSQRTLVPLFPPTPYPVSGVGDAADPQSLWVHSTWATLELSLTPSFHSR